MIMRLITAGLFAIVGGLVVSLAQPTPAQAICKVITEPVVVGGIRRCPVQRVCSGGHIKRCKMVRRCPIKTTTRTICF